MKGRVHYYEGYDISDVVLPTRLMKRMGAEILFLTNAIVYFRFYLNVIDIIPKSGPQYDGYFGYKIRYLSYTL